MSLRQGCSPPGTGGVDAPSRKCREASFERRGRGGQFGETFRESDHPVCAASERIFFLMAQPPLLFQEGNTLASRSSLTLKNFVKKTKAQERPLIYSHSIVAGGFDVMS